MSELKRHSFTFHKPVVIRDGKSHYPDVLCIEMEPFFAWEMIRSLLSQLRSGKEIINYDVSGELDSDTEAD